MMEYTTWDGGKLHIWGNTFAPGSAISSQAPVKDFVIPAGTVMVPTNGFAKQITLKADGQPYVLTQELRVASYNANWAQIEMASANETYTDVKLLFHNASNGLIFNAESNTNLKNVYGAWKGLELYVIRSYSKASEQYKTTNKDVMDAQKAQEKLTDAFAEFGRVGEPILTAIKDKVADMVAAAVPHLENFVQKVKDISTWVKENKDTIDIWVAVILGAGTAIGTFLLILNWGKIMTAAANAVKTVRLAILGMNAAMLANPVGLIVALLAGLVVAFVYLWNNVEGFRKFWIKAWDLIKSAASKAKAAITKAFSNIGSWFKEKFGQIQKAGQNVMDKVKGFFSSAKSKITSTFSNIGSWFGDKFRSAWNGVKNAFSSWGSFFGGLWTKIKSKFGSIGSSLGKTMGDAVKSGMNKVISAIQGTINKGIGLINSAIRLANKLPGINVGTVPKLSLPRLAKGGVLERGQIGLLEGTGAEAVVPLEHNRAWLSRVAEDLNELQGNRGGNTSEITSLLNRAIDLLEDIARMKICLDSGAMVGELVPAIDGRLSDRWSHAKRGNTR
jgi:phage-related protein